MVCRACIGSKCQLVVLCLALFIIQLGLSLSDLPSLKLMQDIICKRHFHVTADELLLEERCRSEPVQEELNVIQMGISISSTAGSKLMGPLVPY